MFQGVGPLSPSSEHCPLVPSPTEPSHHPSTLETEMSSDWEPLAEFEEQASTGRPATPDTVLGKAVVKGLSGSQLLQWEVSFELRPPGPEGDGGGDADLWRETFHHLAARAIIRDFEQLAEREGEIEQGERPGPAPSSPASEPRPFSSPARGPAPLTPPIPLQPHPFPLS